MAIITATIRSTDGKDYHTHIVDVEVGLEILAGVEDTGIEMRGWVEQLISTCPTLGNLYTTYSPMTVARDANPRVLYVYGPDGCIKLEASPDAIIILDEIETVLTAD